MSPKRFSIEVQARLPERLRDLNVLANNLLYAWDRRVRRVLVLRCWWRSWCG